MELIRTGEEIGPFLIDGLNRFNQKALGLPDKSSLPICYEVMSDGKRVAGIQSHFYFQELLFIAYLFVEEEYRKSGIGANLLSAVEEEGKKLGAKVAHVDTFSFQAKNFYLRHGYEVYGILKDCPEGHARYYFRKTL